MVVNVVTDWAPDRSYNSFPSDADRWQHTISQATCVAFNIELPICIFVLSIVVATIMAVEVRLFVKLLYIFMVLYSIEVTAHAETKPVVNTISLLNVTSITNANNEYFRKLLLEFKGRNFFTGMAVRFTSNLQKKGTECVSGNNSGTVPSSVISVWLNSTVAYMTTILPAESESTVYLCVKTAHTVALNSVNIKFGGEVIKWVHQGEDVVLRTGSHPDRHLLSR
jgi:hypothetical protein